MRKSVGGGGVNTWLERGILVQSTRSVIWCYSDIGIVSQDEARY